MDGGRGGVKATNASLTHDKSSIQDAGGSVATAVIVSFSFVNKDLRDTFRSRFPHAKWLLVDTTEDEAQGRIQTRQGHFYKGKVTTTDVVKDQHEQTESSSNAANNDKEKDYNEWEFAPVEFPHIVLNGENSVAENAEIVANVVVEETMKHDARQ
jgi:hypothetical protein